MKNQNILQGIMMASSQVATYNPPAAYLPSAVVQVPRTVVDYARSVLNCLPHRLGHSIGH